jgi:titin
MGKVANTGNGVEILSASNTVGGTTAGARNLLSGNTQDGVLLDAGASGNWVAGDFIGINASGTGSMGNGVNGVELLSSNNTVGGTLAGARNVISANRADGVLIHSGVSGVQFQGNFIGTAYTGTGNLGNKANGVDIYGANNTVGGSLPGARNVISANVQDGVFIETGADGVAVVGNLIGTIVNGTSALGNGNNGIEVAANGTVIGGLTVPSRNVISGNSGDGVLIDSGATGTAVLGNFIGTNTGGSSALANSASGVEIQGSSNTLGGTTSGARNIISGNTLDGVNIDNGANSNVVQGNFIGTNLTATTSVANGSYGYAVGPYNSSNLLGGNVAADSNVIAYNATGGVCLGYGGTGNTVRHNAIYANGGSTGIVLINGGNNNIAAPTLSMATLNGTSLNVTGTFNAATANVPYILEFFANPTGDSEGRIFLGMITVTPLVAGSQSLFFSVASSTFTTNPLITATLTDSTGDTSPFSNSVTS